MDVVARFLDEACVVAEYAKVKASAIDKAYQDWCGRTGEDGESQRTFSQRVAEHLRLDNKLFERYPNNGIWWRGVGLVDTKTEE